LRFLLEQIVQVAVQEAVLPDQLEEHVEEQPGVLDVGHRIGGLQQFVKRRVVAREQRIDQLVLGRVVVVEVAGADVQLGRDQAWC
jgi:hypothetical protein